MTIRACALIAWPGISLFACDPSLSGYDLARPHDGGADVSTLDDGAPPFGAGGHHGAASLPETGTPSARGGSLDAMSGSDAPLSDARGDASTCTLGVRSKPTFAIASSIEVGLLEPPSGVYFRDGAASGLFAQTPIWLFHDTDWASDAGTVTQLPATAGFGNLANPSAVQYDVDTTGAPLPLLSLTPEEKALNAVDGGQYQNVFLWPNAFAADGATGYVFYAMGLRKGFLDYEYLGTGVARLTSGKLVATRDPALLFEGAEPKFDLGAVVVAGYLHLYACGDVNDQSGRCYLARAPKDGWTDRKQYEFWDGCAWTFDLQRRAEIMSGVATEMTVSYNRYLKSYLAVYTEGRTVDGAFLNDVVFRTAPNPEGPWSDPIRPFSQMASANGFRYGAKEHPEFASESGKVVLVSYPVNGSGFSNEIHLVKVTFD